MQVIRPTPTPYSDLNKVLYELVNSMQKILLDKLVGVYLQGSFAIGDFDEDSDVDFIVVIEEELSSSEVIDLQTMHERIYQLSILWAQHLEGSYFPQNILLDHQQQGKDLWYVDHGSTELERSDHCNTIVVRWALREKGITLLGPPPHTLVNPISADLLRRDIYGVITNWGAEILADTNRYNNCFYQGYFMLNFSRMLHDLHTGMNGSKWAGAEWTKQHLDSQWHDLIERAWNCRHDPATKVRQPADPNDYARTLQFIEYVMDECRQFAQNNLKDNDK